MSKRVSTILSVLALIIVFVGLPIAALSYQAHRTGMSLGSFLERAFRRMSEEGTHDPEMQVAGRKGEKIDFVTSQPIGDAFEDPPHICHLIIVDLDQDGLLDVVACDDVADRVVWVRQGPAGTYTETDVGSTVRTPAHVDAYDIDGDGDLDLLVGVMGMLFPNNDRIGSVVVMENDGQQNFTNRVLVDRVARVNDVRAGDLDGDGDADLAVAQFGYDDGELRWMENKGNWEFESHMLLHLSGAIHMPIVDVDQDGDLDMVALVSQEWEEIYVFENDGKGNFTTKAIYGSTNEDFGSSGLSVVDLDQDGDPDLLYTNGDAFDYLPPGPRPWHGVQWLENKGNIEFTFHRIADYPGAYSARPLDVDGDGDLDVFAVSAFHDWKKPDSQSFLWYENDGQMNFIEHDLAGIPTHILALEIGDMDGDGDADFVTGGMHIYPPYDRMGRIMLWTNHWSERGVSGTK